MDEILAKPYPWAPIGRMFFVEWPAPAEQRLAVEAIHARAIADQRVIEVRNMNWRKP